MTDNILEIETNLTSWISISIILLTASILLYHVSVISLKIPSNVAGLIVSLFIICDSIFLVTSLTFYNLRIREEPNFKTSNEEIYSIVYTTGLTILLIAQLIICYYIIRDSYQRTKQRKSKRKSKSQFSVFI